MTFTNEKLLFRKRTQPSGIRVYVAEENDPDVFVQFDSELPFGRDWSGLLPCPVEDSCRVVDCMPELWHGVDLVRQEQLRLYQDDFQLTACCERWGNRELKTPLIQYEYLQSMIKYARRVERDAIYIGITAEQVNAYKAALRSSADRTLPAVPALVWSDDGVVEAKFNVTPYLHQADDKILREVIQEQGHGEAVRSIVDKFAGEEPSIANLFRYLRDIGLTGPVFRCLLDSRAFAVWLDIYEPRLFT